MALETARTIEIDELVLRLPGLDRERARAVAEHVAELLARALSVRELSSVPAGLALRIRLGNDTPAGDLPVAITRQILEALE